MKIRHILIICCSLLLLSACSKDAFRYENYTGEDEQQAKQILEEDKRIRSVAALFHEDELLVGIRVETFSRFKKKKIARELQDQLAAQYPSLNVTVSADSKLLYETNQLIDRGEEQDLNKKIKSLQSLMKEET